MKKLYLHQFLLFIPFTFSLCLYGCGGDINTNLDPNFDNDGHLIRDTTGVGFERKWPISVNFFVEVSGSMNGFFRANNSTEFKTDVWDILSSFSELSPSVSILTNDGSQGATLPLGEFRNKMNTGAFVSTASTRVPTMLQTILSNLDADAGEVAVLISDMKYSPVGDAAPSVLRSQYSTDINRILGQFGKSISVICATSDYLDRHYVCRSFRTPAFDGVGFLSHKALLK